MGISRVRGVGALASVLVFAVVGWACAASEEKQVLYVYTWEGYFDPVVVKEFEDAHGCRVDFDYFDSYDTMYERIRNGESGYDLITPAANLAADLEKRGLLRPLNRRLIPNMRHLDTSLLVPFPDLEMRYHVPYTCSITGIGYNSRLLPPDAVGSWDIYELAGNEKRGSLMNDPRSVIGAALKYLGYSINSTDPVEIRAAGEMLAKWKRNVAMFDVNLPLGELQGGRLSFVQAFSGNVAQITDANPDLDFYIPREGSILNSDYFVIPVDAVNHELAHAFINHIFNPKMAARTMESILYYMPNRAALAQISREFRNNTLLFFPLEDIERSEAIRDVGDSQAYYDKEWESLLMDGN